MNRKHIHFPANRNILHATFLAAALLLGSQAQAQVMVRGSVYGGGNAADVKTNATVTMSSGVVQNRVFGGCNLGSVGTVTATTTPITQVSGTDFNHSTHTGCIGKPKTFQDGTGVCTVTVSGGRVGIFGMQMPDDYGYVFGASRGEMKDPALDEDIEFRAYVKETHVTISGTAFIIGGVYGGSENGRVLTDTHVTIEGGQIGCGEGKTEPYEDSQFFNPITTKVTSNNALAECAHWPYGQNTTGHKYAPYDTNAGESYYDAKNGWTTGDDGHTFYGNVFGGGSGYFAYEKSNSSDYESDNSRYAWLSSAGLVEGDTHVTITGGHILTSVYGGNEFSDVAGTCHVQMSGGTIGVPRTLQQITGHPVTCYLFGAGKGDQRILFNKSTNVGSVDVQISGGIIYGSVFGGGEDGHVQKDVSMSISDGIIGTWGTSYMDGNVFGGGRGFGGDAYTAGNIAGSVTMNIEGGRMLGSIYGGGRLGSVGYGLYDVSETGYGLLRSDTKMDDNVTDGTSYFTHGRGHVTINISGGIIGNDIEYTYNPDLAYKTANMPLTVFEDDTNRLLHTKGGNVFAGGMGRDKQVDGVTPIPAYDSSNPASIDWHKLGNVKSTDVTISGEAWIKSNVYGGGELGAVRSYYEGELSNPTKIEGGTTKVTIRGGTVGTMIGPDIDGGTKDTESVRGTGDNRYCFGSVYGGGYGTEEHIASLTTKNMEDFAALVLGNTDVQVTGGRVLGSVYGGGEVACIGGSTKVEVTGGEIGVNEIRRDPTASGLVDYVLFGSWRMGNVYGGGRGSENAICAGLIRENTTVNISGSPGIYHNIYGGGAIGSVGWFTFADQQYHNTVPDVPVDAPLTWSNGTGTATVTITGTPVIGINGHDNGMVCGSSRGDVSVPAAADGVDIYDRLAWVKDTKVTIGTQGDSEGPDIRGSVYGGGENGHNSGNTEVTIYSGNVGEPGSTDTWLTRGNVFGGGCGTDTYTDNNDVKHHNKTAGFVLGTADVNIHGGQVMHGVYGGGSLGSVGAQSTVNVDGGVINNNVFGGPKGDLSDDETVAHAKQTEVNILPHPTDASKPGAEVRGSVYGGGEAGLVEQSVEVNIKGGTVINDVYGGGALADTNTSNVSDYDTGGRIPSSTNTYTTAVNLHGGTIGGTAYGGGLGRKYKAAVPANPLQGIQAQDEVEAKEAFVYGDVTVKLNEDSDDDCKVKKIHGCNNLNGTPKGNVLVHVYKTVAYGDGTHLKDPNKENASYDMDAVYGGGNEAAYDPVENSNKSSEVIIDGCELSSINFVYGGGNAAPAPDTKVTVNGCYEVYSVFGGGNGADAMADGTANPGADVGYKPNPVSGKDSYGGGMANVDIYGGTFHNIFGGSNTLGNVRTSATVSLDELKDSNDEPICPLVISEVYGAGNKAQQDGKSEIKLNCLSYLKELYGGAREADIDNDVVLTVQSGRFDRVFGGNNLGGKIKGTITVNIEETGCHPIIIGQLYGGGNQAAYTAPWKDENNHSLGQKDGPTVNVKSFTSIGEIYGGGYGASAVVTGDTHINIDECVGENATIEMKKDGNNTTVDPVTGETVPVYTDESEHTGETLTIAGRAVTIHPHKSGEIGVIGNVFGGGNAAAVDGDTYVNIGTIGAVEYESIQDDPATPTVNESVREYKGVNIQGNVFGGGNAAEVTGNTHVLIGENGNP